MEESAGVLDRLMWGSPSRSDLQELVDGAIPEGLRVEYKREVGNGKKILEAVCALANTFGGVVIVDVDESERPEHHGFGVPGPDGLVGVTPNQRSRLAQLCSNNLVLPYDPQIVPIGLDDGKVALVVRVDASAAPRPLTVDDRVLVRTEAGNRPADLFRLRQLFHEGRTGGSSQPFLGTARAWPSNHPTFRGDNPADMVVRLTGATALVAGAGRPILSDTARATAKAALDASALSAWLMQMHDDPGAAPMGGGVTPWLPRGRNFSNRLELRWEGLLPDRGPFPEARFVIEWPRPTPGAPPPMSLTVILDVVLRLQAIAPNGAPARRLTLDELYYLVSASLDLFGGPLPDLLDAILPRTPGPILGPTLGTGIREQQSLDTVLNTDGMMPMFTEEVPRLGQGGFVFPAAEVLPRSPDGRRMLARDLLVELLTDNCLIGVEVRVDNAAGIPRPARSS